MEITKGRPATQSTRQPEPSKCSRIVLLLSAFGVRRQAKLEDQDYLVYASDLERFELTDIEEVLRKIALRPREEFEPAFPDIGTLIRAIEQREYNRKTRIRPEQLRPEAREAIERAEEYKRLEASGAKLAKENVAGLIEGAAKKLSMGE